MYWEVQQTGSTLEQCVTVFLTHMWAKNLKLMKDINWQHSQRWYNTSNETLKHQTKLLDNNAKHSLGETCSTHFQFSFYLLKALCQSFPYLFLYQPLPANSQQKNWLIKMKTCDTLLWSSLRLLCSCDK